MSGTSEQLVESFEHCALPLPEWNHRAHVTVAITYLLRHGRDGALAKLRTNIQRFNAANGIVQTQTGGYHETMTRFWLWAVERFVASVDRTRPVDELAQKFATETDRYLNRQYYSRELFMSWDARLNWVEPDLKALEPINGNAVATKLMQISIRENLDGVDGAALKHFYVDAEFDNDRSPEQYETAFRNSVVRLAYAGDELIGIARAISDGVKAAAIFDVAVLPQYRRQGVGRQLVRSLVDGLPEGAFIILTCPNGREPFYKHLGFEPSRFPAMTRPDDLVARHD